MQGIMKLIFFLALDGNFLEWVWRENPAKIPHTDNDSEKFI
jgi:hypothetical protein